MKFQQLQRHGIIQIREMLIGRWLRHRARALGLAMLATAVLVFPSGHAYATAIFFSPDSASSTNTSTPAMTTVAPGQLIDLSGLSSTPVTLANIGSILHSDGPTPPTDLWRGDSSALPITLTFDFNSLQTINFVGLWQGFSNREGTAGFNLEFWNGAGGTGALIGGVFSSILDLENIPQGTIPLYGRSFDVGHRENVSSITMEITSIAREVNPFVHLGEFMVAGPSTSIPEPSTSVSEPTAFALFAFGLTILGVRIVARHRRIT